MSQTVAPLASQFKPVSSVNQLSSRFAPVVAQAPLTDGTTKSTFDYFDKMEIDRNVELDSGFKTIYDVQSDTRFLKNYSEQYVGHNYPELNIKGHPMVSPPSLTGYDLTLFYAHLLGCDVYHREGMSYWAKIFMTDAKKKELFNELLNCHVPSHMTEFLLSMAPVYDPRRSKHLYVPSLAGYSHSHDFGRTIPPLIYFIAHHKLASLSSRKEPYQYMNIIYDSNVVTFGTQEFKVSNYFGTAIDAAHHPNWVNDDFETFFNPVVGRALTQRPTLGKMPFHPATYADQTSFDTYEFFFNAQDDNIDNELSMIRALSAFHQVHDPKAPKLGSILASLSGALLPMHSIEPPTLPTWTGKKNGKSNVPEDPTPVTDATWATTTHQFLIAPQKQTGKVDWLDSEKGLFKKLYMVVKQKFDYSSNPVEYITFSKSEHVSPYVLYFQPYDVSPSSIALVIVAGLKIEVAEIDGVGLPLESPQNSLDDNNSLTKPAAIRLSNIAPVFFAADPATELHRVWRREGVDRTEEGILLAFRSMRKNVLPTIGNEDVYAPSGYPANIPMDDEGIHDDIRTAVNIRAGTNGNPCMTNIKAYLWSSYRIVTKYAKPDTKDILMIASFRPVYGLNVTLSRSKNPSLIIPH